MKKSSLRLKGKIALITGGAQGIGREMATRFAREGATVIISDLQEKSGGDAVQSLRKEGLSAHFVQTDLRREKDIRQMVLAALRPNGQLDIVVNNARPKLRQGIFKETLKDWNLAMQVILKAPALIMKYATPYLSKSHGAVVNIVSPNAFTVSHQSAAYHVAKAGLVQLTRYLAYEFGASGIRVNAVCPALVDMTDRPSLTSNQNNKAITELIVPLKRAAHPADIAEAAIFLCSEPAAYITGEVLTVDGGVSLGDQFHVARSSFQYAQSNHQTK